jgi:hypothetical protein
MHIIALDAYDYCHILVSALREVRFEFRSAIVGMRRVLVEREGCAAAENEE